MKKTSKILAVVIVAALAVAALVVFAACGGQTLTGEAHYQVSYDGGVTKLDYGVKVDVTVKGDIITGVKLYSEEATGWTRTSADNADHGWTGHDATEAAYDKWINDNFVGANVADVLAWSASATAAGQHVYNGPIIEYAAGETAQQSSARIIVAVQNALEKLDGLKKVTGEYSYESYGHTYGVKVDVFVKDGAIFSVRMYTDAETGWVRTTASWEENKPTEGNLGFAKAEAAYEQYLKDTFRGKTVEEVNAYQASKEDWSISEGAKLAGATQSAVRIVLAVQNALSKLA